MREMLKQYQSYLLFEKRLSKKSSESYLQDLMQLEKFLDEQKSDLLCSQRKHVEGYLKQLADLGYAHKSLHRFLSSFKGFYFWLMKQEKIQENPAEGVALPQILSYKPDCLSISQIEKIYQVLPQNTALEMRDFILIELLYSLGLRISEAINVCLDWLNLDEKVMIVTGKGNKQRVIPLGTKMLPYLKEYLQTYRLQLTPQSNHLLLNYQGKNLSRMGAYKRVRTIVQIADISQKISPHSFRHSYATHLIEAGADLRVVQELLGHKNIQTTQIYTHINAEYLKEVHFSFHPRNQIGKEIKF